MVRDLNLDVPCKNMKSGCQKKNHSESIEEHETECEYRPLFLSGEVKPFKEYLDSLKESQRLLLGKGKHNILEVYKEFYSCKDIKFS